MQTDLFGGADRAPRSFEQDAMGFLIKFARKSRGQSFSSEDVTIAAMDAGIAPLDLRSWGTVFAQAAKDGYIRRSDVLFRRTMGNGSLAPGWVGA
jgi:hypothetical protein